MAPVARRHEPAQRLQPALRAADGRFAPLTSPRTPPRTRRRRCGPADSGTRGQPRAGNGHTQPRATSRDSEPSGAPGSPLGRARQPRPCRGSGRQPAPLLYCSALSLPPSHAPLRLCRGSASPTRSVPRRAARWGRAALRPPLLSRPGPA